MHMEDDAIRTLVIRLSRAHPSGGEVIERAAILAEGADLAAVEGWIIAHDGRPEAKAAPSVGRGLHGTRLAAAAGASGPPARYVLPAGALS
jgi:predicted fused transcriptional regulator/phosphomethylpyrimidine kinase